MTLTPVKIERRSEEAIRIEWSDGSVREYGVKELRKSCPCAGCWEKQNQREQQQADPLSLPVLSPTETVPVRIAGMKPVGLYAYKIDFSDGHNLGIYTFDLLRKLGKEIT